MPEANASIKPGPTQLSFFQAIFANMTETPDVDWGTVAATAGYNSASTARTRFGQIRRELLKGVGQAGPKSPFKPRAKKEAVKSEIGSGTNLSPCKVAKSIPMRGRSKSVGGKPARVLNGKRIKEDDFTEEKEENQVTVLTRWKCKIDIEWSGWRRIVNP